MYLESFLVRRETRTWGVLGCYMYCAQLDTAQKVFGVIVAVREAISTCWRRFQCYTLAQVVYNTERTHT